MFVVCFTERVGSASLWFAFALVRFLGEETPATELSGGVKADKEAVRTVPFLKMRLAETGDSLAFEAAVHGQALDQNLSPRFT